MDYTKFLFGLLNALVLVRTQTRSISECHRWGHYGNVQGRLALAVDIGLITHQQYCRFSELLSNACQFQGNPFVGDALFGPVMPRWIASARRVLGKPQTEVPADAHAQVSRQAASTGLRLLCVLVPSRTGEARSLPVHTMRRLPPLLCQKGRWSLADNPGFHLRETHAKPATAAVLARCARHRSTHAIRFDLRAV